MQICTGFEGNLSNCGIFSQLSLTYTLCFEVHDEQKSQRCLFLFCKLPSFESQEFLLLIGETIYRRSTTVLQDNTQRFESVLIIFGNVLEKNLRDFK